MLKGKRDGGGKGIACILDMRQIEEERMEGREGRGGRRRPSSSSKKFAESELRGQGGKMEELRGKGEDPGELPRENGEEEKGFVRKKGKSWRVEDYGRKRRRNCRRKSWNKLMEHQICRK
jgi:hypothetical protein